MPGYATGTNLASSDRMRWKASPPEIVWKREFETRLGAVMARLPAFLCWLALLVAYTGLMAVLYVSKVPRFDAIVPLTGHLIGLGLAATAALVLGRRPILILASGVLVTVLAHAIPFYVPDRAALAVAPVAEARGDREPSLKVMAFNVWRENRDPALMVRAIETSGADVVMLSEVSPARQAELEPLSRTYPYAVICGLTNCDQMLLSKVPLEATGALAASWDQPVMVWARLAGSGPAAGVTVVSTHLYRASRSYRLHRRQLEGLIGQLGQLEGPLVLGGDLNATIATRSYAELTRRAGLKGAGRTLPSWPVYPLALPQFGIDHLLVRGLAIRESGLGAYAGSDHLPVWSRIALPEDRSRG